MKIKSKVSRGIHSFVQWVGKAEFFTFTIKNQISICELFWKGSWNIIAFLFAISFASFITFGAAGAVGYGILLNFFSFPEDPTISGYILGFLVGIVLIATFFAVFILFCVGLYLSVEWIKNYSKNRPHDEEKEPNLVQIWYKAHKEKWCPVLDFKKED